MPKISQTENEVRIALENGHEVFTAADPMEATQKLAQSLDDNKAYWKNQQQEYETKIAQLQANQKQDPAPAVDPTVAYWKNLAVQANAEALGYPNAEAWKQNEAYKAQQLADANMRSMVLKFNAQHPEFNPANGAGDKLIEDTFENFKLSRWGKDMDAIAAIDPDIAGTMVERELAYKYYTGEFKPMTPEEQRRANSDAAAIQQNRPTAPPMLQGSNPEQSSGGQLDPNTMSMADLRKLAIQQQLGQK